MTDRQTDYYTEAGARELATKIERYWKRAGFTKVMVAIEPISSGRLGVGYTVKSNIGIGGPPV